MTDSREHDIGPPGTTQETQIRRHLKQCWMLIKESSQCRNGPEFYNHGSVHRDSTLIRSKEMQQYAVCRCLLTAKLLYMSRVSIASIIRSTSNCNCSFWYRSYHVSEQQPSASV